MRSQPPSLLRGTVHIKGRTQRKKRCGGFYRKIPMWKSWRESPSPWFNVNLRPSLLLRSTPVWTKGREKKERWNTTWNIIASVYFGQGQFLNFSIRGSNKRFFDKLYEDSRAESCLMLLKLRDNYYSVFIWIDNEKYITDINTEHWKHLYTYQKSEKLIFF